MPATQVLIQIWHLFLVAFGCHCNFGMETQLLPPKEHVVLSSQDTANLEPVSTPWHSRAEAPAPAPAPWSSATSPSLPSWH